ncbi:hypothetical protein MMKA1_08220 [Methanococcus maripaludis KA1]|jgi:hypothetical protein|uniref:Uncharacterized protein n=1 Tax=Methanococcus maripaludis KA1 TaxID=637914 RepID=A0A2Z5PD78_METMI|nr:hypothetical protein [Methanococcus maripaludis]BAP60939.1 hypothetical protein MMKA1_08220 [Methanococcus maripaludis KA1]
MENEFIYFRVTMNIEERSEYIMYRGNENIIYVYENYIDDICRKIDVYAPDANLLKNMDMNEVYYHVLDTDSKGNKMFEEKDSLSSEDVGQSCMPYYHNKILDKYVRPEWYENVSDLTDEYFLDLFKKEGYGIPEESVYVDFESEEYYTKCYNGVRDRYVMCDIYLKLDKQKYDEIGDKLIHNGFEILDEDCKWYFENN